MTPKKAGLRKFRIEKNEFGGWYVYEKGGVSWRLISSWPRRRLARLFVLAQQVGPIREVVA